MRASLEVVNFLAGKIADVSEFKPYPRHLARPGDKVPKIVTIIEVGTRATVEFIRRHRVNHQ